MQQQADKKTTLVYYETLLKNSDSIEIRLHGNCMWPIVKDGDLLSIEPTSYGHLKFGDVAIFKTSDESLHANVIFTSNRRLRKKEASPKNYLGRVTLICRKKKPIKLDQRSLLFRLLQTFIAPANPYFWGLPKTIKKRITKEP